MGRLQEEQHGMAPVSREKQITSSGTDTLSLKGLRHVDEAVLTLACSNESTRPGSQLDGCRHCTTLIR